MRCNGVALNIAYLFNYESFRLMCLIIFLPNQLLAVRLLMLGETRVEDGVSWVFALHGVDISLGPQNEIAVRFSACALF